LGLVKGIGKREILYNAEGDEDRRGRGDNKYSQRPLRSLSAFRVKNFFSYRIPRSDGNQFIRCAGPEMDPPARE